MNTMTVTRKPSDEGLSEDIKRDAAKVPVITPDYVVLRREDIPRLAGEIDDSTASWRQKPFSVPEIHKKVRRWTRCSGNMVSDKYRVIFEAAAARTFERLTQRQANAL